MGSIVPADAPTSSPSGSLHRHLLGNPDPQAWARQLRELASAEIMGKPMVKLEVNGQSREVEVDPATPLLYVLRNDLQLNGAKFGCGQAQCGACTVMLDREAIFSCVVPVAAAAGRKVTTIEGLGTIEQPGPMQRAFIEEQAAQCGYCIPGMMMRAQALLEHNRTPSPAEIREHMSTNLCRCGTHMRILRAVEKAAVLMKVADAGGAVK